MKKNFRNYPKQTMMIVFLSMTTLFFFTLGAYANEVQGGALSRNDETILNDARTLWEAGDKTGVRELLLGYFEDTSTISEEMFLSLGRALYNYEKTEEAVIVYEKAHRAYPESEKLIRAYAGMLFKNQQYAEAAPLLEKVYDISGNMEARQLLSAAQAYFMAENPEKAKQLLKKIIDQPGVSQPSVLSLLHEICASLGEIEEADEYLKKYIGVANKKIISQTMIEGSLCKSAYGTDDANPLIIKEADSPPQLASMLPPMYPTRASVEGLSGRVVLMFVVDRDGYVREPKVTSAEPEGFFEESALDAVTEYRFLPAMKDGECVAWIVRMPVKYELNKTLQ